MLFALAPGTFELSWAGFGKLGRGGLFFVLFFLAFELWDFRKTHKPQSHPPIRCRSYDSFGARANLLRRRRHIDRAYQPDLFDRKLSGRSRPSQQ